MDRRPSSGAVVALALILLLAAGLWWRLAGASIDGQSRGSHAGTGEEAGNSSALTSVAPPSSDPDSNTAQAQKVSPNPRTGAPGGHVCGSSCQHQASGTGAANRELTEVEKYSIKHDYFPIDLTPATLPDGHFKAELVALPAATQRDVVRRLLELKIPPINLHSLHVDSGGALFYACEPLTRTRLDDDIDESEQKELSSELSVLMEQFLASGAAASAVPISSPPQRSSRPGAPNTIYLDFNGHIVTGTQWNTSFGSGTYDCLPWDLDGDVTTFSVEEQAAIVGVWERVAEDFAPFNVNVTTVEPSVFNNRVARALITRSTDRFGVNLPWHTAGGVAYVDVFARSDYVSRYSPAFVYYDRISRSASNIADCASHEVGHNLGLSHDGQVAQGSVPAVEYYRGHGSGATSWAPLMGSSYGKNISQWSKGEYYLANQQQDDLAIVASKLSYRVDDHPSTLQAAVPLSGSVSGVVETGSDRDTWYVDTYSTLGIQLATTLVVDGGANGGNLHGAVRVYNAQGALVSSLSNSTTPNINTSLTVSPGRYYIEVGNAGIGNPLVISPTGYTVYGSIGQYSLSIQTNTQPTEEPVINSSLSAMALVGRAFDYQITAANFPTSFGATGLPPGISLDTTTGLISGTPSAPGIYSVTLTATNIVGSGTATLTITVTDVVFSENMGAPPPSAIVAVSSHTFENSGRLTFTGTADVRSSTVSTNYAGVSGLGNVFFTTTVGRVFEISGINTFGFTDLTLSFGHYKSAIAANNELTIEVSADGATYTPLSYTRPTGSGTANWRLVEPTGNIPSTENLRIRFRQTSTTAQFRIDDVVLSGVPPLPPSIVEGATTSSGESEVDGLTTYEVIRGFSTTLSVSASDEGGEGNLIYTWSATGGSVTFSPNGTNSAQSSTATFLAAGDYTLTVTVRNAAGGTATSSVPVRVKQVRAGQTITFDEINDQLATDVLVLSATASSGLPVTFSLDGGPAILDTDGVTLTFTGEGIVSITASQTGDDFWHPAPDVTNTFMVSKVSAYGAWADSFGLDPAADGAPTADADADGFTNAQEFAFGTSPVAATASLLTTQMIGGNLVLMWLERGDVTYNVQSTGNLATTAFAKDGTATVDNGPAEPVPPAGYTRKQFSVPASGKNFYRVTAEVPAP